MSNCWATGPRIQLDDRANLVKRRPPGFPEKKPQDKEQGDGGEPWNSRLFAPGESTSRFPASMSASGRVIGIRSKMMRTTAVMGAARNAPISPQIMPKKIEHSNDHRMEVQGMALDPRLQKLPMTNWIAAGTTMAGTLAASGMPGLEQDHGQRQKRSDDRSHAGHEVQEEGQQGENAANSTPACASVSPNNRPVMAER